MLLGACTINLKQPDTESESIIDPIKHNFGTTYTDTMRVIGAWNQTYAEFHPEEKKLLLVDKSGQVIEYTSSLNSFKHDKYHERGDIVVVNRNSTRVKSITQNLYQQKLIDEFTK